MANAVFRSYQTLLHHHILLYIYIYVYEYCSSLSLFLSDVLFIWFLPPRSCSNQKRKDNGKTDTASTVYSHTCSCLDIHTFCILLSTFHLNPLVFQSLFFSNRISCHMLPLSFSRPLPPCRCAWRQPLGPRHSDSTLGSSNRSRLSCARPGSTGELGQLCRRTGPTPRRFDSLPDFLPHESNFAT